MKYFLVFVAVLLSLGAEKLPAENQPAEKLAAEKLEYIEETPKIETAEAHHVYTKRGTVYGIEYADDAVIVVDENGELWEFYGAEGWSIDDPITLTMEDTGVPGYAWDDAIIAAY